MTLIVDVAQLRGLRDELSSRSAQIATIRTARAVGGLKNAMPGANSGPMAVSRALLASDAVGVTSERISNTATAVEASAVIYEKTEDDNTADLSRDGRPLW